MIAEVFNGYLDETGIDSSKDIVAVGGWVSTFEKWSVFEKHWRNALPKEAHGDFHYTDFWARHTYGADWSNEERLNFIGKLARIARSSASFGVGMVISKTHYENIIPEEDKRLIKSPLHFCMGHCLSMILKWYKRIPGPPPAPLRFMFDGKKKHGAIADLYYSVRDSFDRGNILGDLSFGERKNEPGLQAADLLVGELRRDREERPKSVIASILQEDKSILVSFPREDELRAYVKTILGK